MPRDDVEVKGINGALRGCKKREIFCGHGKC